MRLLYPPSLDGVKPAFLATDKTIQIPFAKPTYANWPEGEVILNVRAVQQNNNKPVITNLKEDMQKIISTEKYFTFWDFNEGVSISSIQKLKIERLIEYLYTATYFELLHTIIQNAEYISQGFLQVISDDLDIFKTDYFKNKNQITDNELFYFIQHHKDITEELINKIPLQIYSNVFNRTLTVQENAGDTTIIKEKKVNPVYPYCDSAYGIELHENLNKGLINIGKQYKNMLTKLNERTQELMTILNIKDGYYHGKVERCSIDINGNLESYIDNEYKDIVLNADGGFDYISPYWILNTFFPIILKYSSTAEVEEAKEQRRNIYNTESNWIQHQLNINENNVEEKNRLNQVKLNIDEKWSQDQLFFDSWNTIDFKIKFYYAFYQYADYLKNIILSKNFNDYHTYLSTLQLKNWKSSVPIMYSTDADGKAKWDKGIVESFLSTWDRFLEGSNIPTQEVLIELLHVLGLEYYDGRKIDINKYAEQIDKDWLKAQGPLINMLSFMPLETSANNNEYWKSNADKEIWEDEYEYTYITKSIQVFAQNLTIDDIYMLKIIAGFYNANEGLKILWQPLTKKPYKQNENIVFFDFEDYDILDSQLIQFKEASLQCLKDAFDYLHGGFDLELIKSSFQKNYIYNYFNNDLKPEDIIKIAKLWRDESSALSKYWVNGKFGFDFSEQLGTMEDQFNNNPEAESAAIKEMKYYLLDEPLNNEGKQENLPLSFKIGVLAFLQDTTYDQLIPAILEHNKDYIDFLNNKNDIWLSLWASLINTSDLDEVRNQIISIMESDSVYRNTYTTNNVIETYYGTPEPTISYAYRDNTAFKEQILKENNEIWATTRQEYEKNFRQIKVDYINRFMKNDLQPRDLVNIATYWRQDKEFQEKWTHYNGFDFSEKSGTMVDQFDNNGDEADRAALILMRLYLQSDFSDRKSYPDVQILSLEDRLLVLAKILQKSLTEINKHIETSHAYLEEYAKFEKTCADRYNELIQKYSNSKHDEYKTVAEDLKNTNLASLLKEYQSKQGLLEEECVIKYIDNYIDSPTMFLPEDLIAFVEVWKNDNVVKSYVKNQFGFDFEEKDGSIEAQLNNNAAAQQAALDLMRQYLHSASLRKPDVQELPYWQKVIIIAKIHGFNKNKISDFMKNTIYSLANYQEKANELNVWYSEQKRGIETRYEADAGTLSIIEIIDYKFKTENENIYNNYVQNLTKIQNRYRAQAIGSYFNVTNLNYEDIIKIAKMWQDGSSGLSQYWVNESFDFTKPIEDQIKTDDDKKKAKQEIYNNIWRDNFPLSMKIKVLSYILGYSVEDYEEILFSNNAYLIEKQKCEDERIKQFTKLDNELTAKKKEISVEAISLLKANVMKKIYEMSLYKEKEKYELKIYQILKDNDLLIIDRNQKYFLDLSKMPKVINVNDIDDINWNNINSFPDWRNLPNEVAKWIEENLINQNQSTINKAYWDSDLYDINNFNINENYPFINILSKAVNNPSDNCLTDYPYLIPKSLLLIYDGLSGKWPNDGTYYQNFYWDGNNSNLVISKDYADIKIPLQQDSYLKFQMRIGYYNDNNYDWSEWSTVMVSKALGFVPKLQLHGTFVNNNEQTIYYEPSATPELGGQFEYEGNEILNKYSFSLFDENDNLIETSGWLQNKSTENNTNKYRFKTQLQHQNLYKATYSIITANLYEMSTNLLFQVYISDLQDTSLDDVNMFVLDGEHDHECAEEACIKILLQTKNDSSVTGNLVISRSSEKDNFTYYEPVYRFYAHENKFPIGTNNLGTLLFTDFTIESGIKYKYILQKENSATGLRTPAKYPSISIKNIDNTISFIENKDQVYYTYFEYCYLYVNGVQLKLKYDAKMGSYKQTMLASKQDTLGGKYPIILKNGIANYAEFPVGGLITLHSDENKNFFVEKDDGYYYNDELIIPIDRYRGTLTTTHGRWKTDENGEFVLDENGNKIREIMTDASYSNSYLFNTNLTDENIYIERKFREKVIEFLTQSDIFLYKSPDIGNKIISLMNIAFQPKENLSRLIFAFTSTGYEVLDNTFDNLIEYGLWKINNLQDESSDELLYTEIGQLSGLFAPEDDLVALIKKQVSEMEIANNPNLDIEYELVSIDHFWIEAYPNLNFEELKNDIEFEISSIVLKEDMSIEDEKRQDQLEKEQIALDELEKAMVNEKENKPFIFNRNGEKMVVFPNRIYAADQNIQSLSIITKEIEEKRPFVFTYICKVKKAQKPIRGLQSQSIKTTWGQLNGLFTNEERMIYLARNQQEFYTEYSVLNVYDSLDIIKEIQNHILSQPELLHSQLADKNNYTGPISVIEKDDQGRIIHNEYYYLLNTGEKIVIIFNELSKLNIEANKLTKLNFGNTNEEFVNNFYIGSTERLNLDSLGGYAADLPAITFASPTQAIIDYQYQIQILTWGNGGVELTDEDRSQL